MRYCKYIDGDYILAIGTGDGGEEISENEYSEIMSIILAHPEETETIGYRLKKDLTWEEYEIPPDPNPDLDDSELVEILLGGDAE